MRSKPRGPNLVLTQDLCEVCAVSDGQLHSIFGRLDPDGVLALSGRTVAGVLDDIEAVARRIGRDDAGKPLVASLSRRLRALETTARARRPTVVCVEWLEPLFLAGHWVPELVWAAGGRDVGAAAGSHSATSSWHAVAELDPDILAIMLCGFDFPRAQAEWARFLGSPEGAKAASLRARHLVVDGNAYTSRPGPRIVTGAELLATGFAAGSEPRLRES